MKITAPRDAGFKTRNEWRLTAAVPAPDGSVFIANGYGDPRIFRFDKHGNYKGSFAEKGNREGQLDCSHGLTLDLRYRQPLLMVCDRENRRLCHFDLDGKLSLPKMLSGANAFEISDIERMNIGAYQPGI